MLLSSDPRVISSELVEGGLSVHFEDGRCGLYAAAFLHSYLSFSKQIEALAQGKKLAAVGRLAS